MAQPVIFLDMDGVLSSPRAYVAQTDKEHPDCWIDPIAVRYLNMLCQGCNALVVVSSTWRLGSTRAKFSADMKRWGCVGKLHADWRTVSIETAGCIRGDEVREWMSRHSEVATHVILDDDSDFHPDQPIVVTDGINGFGQEHLRDAFRMLSGHDRGLHDAMQSRLGIKRVKVPTDA